MMYLGLINPQWRTDYLKKYGVYDRQLNRMKSHFDQGDKKLDKRMEKTR